MNLYTLKSRLDEFNQQQRQSFPQTDIFTLLHARSDFYDSLLSELWQQFGFAEQPELTLIAVGGYGRREMFPLSDLDFMVISEQPLDEASQTRLTALFNLLWDSKLQLGTAVRTVADCLAVGQAEISVATNMLEGRFLQGNLTLWQQLREQLFAPSFWPVADFFHAKLSEKTERYQRYHNTGYNLEPDLKHSPGGLRDLHLIQWIMLRHAGIYSLHGLREKGILFEAEFQELIHAQRVLFEMRFGLHLQLKRYDNRLRFDRQLTLAEQLGYADHYPNRNQAVEAMMKIFFQATRSVSQLCELLLNQFQQEVVHPLQKIGEKRPLDALFYLQNGTIYCQHHRQLAQQPHRVLDLFFHLTAEPQAEVAAYTLRNIRQILNNLAQPLCTQPEARVRFIEIFQQPMAIQRAVEPMHRLGVLTAYLPQWQQIEGLMQFDLFHTYTVDEHSVRVMLKLESFLDPQNHTQHPLCGEIFSHHPLRTLIYLAALFHDIAKGREGDHAELGAQDMREFAEQHGFHAAQTDFMCWLVAEHLTMSITAQRRDIHDVTIVKTFAEKVQTTEKLGALLCLTVADICATNETLWNDWKRSLFSKLFHFTQEQLALGEARLNHQTLVIRHKQHAEAELYRLLRTPEWENLQHFWQQCPQEYFLRNSGVQLVWHGLAAAKRPLPLVLVSNQYARGATEVFIHCHDQPQLFTRIAHCMSRKKISIHDAQIITDDNGRVFDSFIVTEHNGRPLSTARCKQIEQQLSEMLAEAPLKPLKITAKPLKHSSFKRQTRLRFLADSQPNQTACELFTLDREGLLVQIGHIFNRLGFSLINAKITTVGEQAEDFFVLQNADGQALSNEEQTALKTLILAELS